MKLFLRYNHPHQPPYHEYPDESSQLITAKTLKELVAAVKTYRETNGLPVGDCEQDVAFYYATKWSWMVETTKAGQIGLLEPKDSPEEAIWRWVNLVWCHPPISVFTASEADARMTSCRECPLNEAFDPAGVDNAELTRRIYLLSRGKGFPAGLGYCRLYKWYTGLAVILPDAGKTVKDKTPAKCWVRTERTPAG